MRAKRNPRNTRTIELGRGSTYSNDRFTVYEHGVYPRGSVLAGQSSRMWLDDFDTLAEAQAAYPDAEVCCGSTFSEPCLSHLPDPEGPDPNGDNADAARDV